MDVFTAWLAKRGVNWWLVNRPFSKEKRAYRKERRRIRRENRARAKKGLPPLEEPDKMFGLRTSTVAGVSGVVALVVMKVVGLVAPDLVASVPGLEETVAGLVAYVAARLNKTPTQAGLI